MADTGLSSQGSGATHGPLDDLRGLGDAIASGVANVDRGLTQFNGVVNDELVDQGVQDLREGNQAGFIWNGIKYSFYNTFMPNNVEGAGVNLAGGAVAGKVVGLVAKGATDLWPVLAKRLDGVVAGGEVVGGDSVVTGTASRAGSTSEYPPNFGFQGATRNEVIGTGVTIDRYGGVDASRFFSPEGTPAEMRSLPPGTDTQALRRFEVLKPIEVTTGRVAPWYGQPGLGTQYRTKLPLGDLLHQGYLREVSK